MSKWSIETLSAACAALILIMLGWLAGAAWPALDFWEHVWLTLLLAAAAGTAMWLMRRLRAHLASTRSQLDASLLRYQNLSETAQDGMWQTDAQGRILYVNQRLCDMLGLPAELLLHHSMEEFHDEATLLRLCPLRQTASDSCMGELQYRHGDGTQRWAMLSGRRLYDQHGTVTGALVLASDITEHKRAEHALSLAHAELESRVALRTAQLLDVNLQLSAEIAMRAQTEAALARSEERLQDIISMMPLSLFLKDADSRMLLMNQACEQQWGVQFQDIAEGRDVRHFPADQTQGFHAADQEAFASRQVVIREELVWNARLQENRLLQTHKKPIFDAQGRPQMIIAMGLNLLDGTLAATELLELRLHAGRLELGLNAFNVLHAGHCPFVFGATRGRVDHQQALIAALGYFNALVQGGLAFGAGDIGYKNRHGVCRLCEWVLMFLES